MVPVHRPVSAVLGVLEASSDAVVATDQHGRIVIWNRAAERLLGYRADHVLGKPCYQVLDGVEPCGGRFCQKECELMKMGRRRESVRQFEMEVRTASGNRVPSTFSILAVPGSTPEEFTIIHLFRPSSRAQPHAQPSRRSPRADGALSPAVLRFALTARELEILKRLDEGASTRDIASALRISVTTVRTHIQHILRKLEVHSRLEAVALTLRKHLI
jgi:PAS domain S-box-containing protein